MNPIHVILQAGNATGIPSPTQFANAVSSTVMGPLLGWLLAAGGAAFLVAIMMIIYNFFEYMMHPTSWGRTAAISEVFSHGKRIIFGALGLWLIIYIISLILELGGVNVNPAATAGQVFTAEFQWLWYFLHTALQHALSTTP